MLSPTWLWIQIRCLQHVAGLALDTVVDNTLLLAEIFPVTLDGAQALLQKAHML